MKNSADQHLGPVTPTTAFGAPFEASVCTVTEQMYFSITFLIDLFVFLSLFRALDTHRIVKHCEVDQWKCSTTKIGRQQKVERLKDSRLVIF